jgi:hypothetical protein
VLAFASLACCWQDDWIIKDLCILWCNSFYKGYLIGFLMGLEFLEDDKIAVKFKWVANGYSFPVNIYRRLQGDLTEVSEAGEFRGEVSRAELPREMPSGMVFLVDRYEGSKGRKREDLHGPYLD